MIGVCNRGPDDEDWEVFLSTLADVIGQMNWLYQGYCLTPNQYYLLIETPPQQAVQRPTATQRGLHPDIESAASTLGSIGFAAAQR